MWLRNAQYALLVLGLFSPANNALVHQQVAFDNSDVCWWGLMPPDLVCPILTQQNLTELVNSIAGAYAWQGGDKCEGVFCLYSNQGFAGGRGIAIITTPASYDRVKAVGDLLKEHDVSFKDTESYPFHAAPIAGKGNGIVADQALKRGDPIMGHTPVLLVHRAFKDALPQAQQQWLVQAAVESLPKHTADLFMAQMAHIPEKHRNAAILTTNAFLLNLKPDNSDGDDGSGHHFGAFPEVSRLNHDCRPKAVYHIDPTTLMHITTAVSTIEPGEEITISYLDPFLPREQRRERLHQHWGFDCQCDQCSLPDEEHEHSETRLNEIQWIETKLTDYSEHRGVSTGLITYLLGLYENEGLHCCLGRAYKLAALNFNGLAYEKQAKMYAELAIEALKLEKGAEAAADISDLEALIKRPNKHWTFSGRLTNIR